MKRVAIIFAVLAVLLFADGQGAILGGAGAAARDGAAAESPTGPAAGQATALLDPDSRRTEGGPA